MFLALAQAGAKNLKAAGALIDLPGDAVPGEDRTLPGLAEQIASLKGREDAAFLFEGSEAPQISGFRPAEGLSPARAARGRRSRWRRPLSRACRRTTTNKERMDETWQ